MNSRPIKYKFLDLGMVNAPVRDALTEAAARVIASGRYIGGEENEAFERELAEYTGTAHAVGVANGLDALRLIFRAYIELGRLKPGDGVIIPANTYIATVLAVTDCGLRPVLVEPDDATMNLDTALIEQAATTDVRAVLPVHLYGRACHDSRLVETARRHDLIVVEDNAQAIGARSAFDRRRTGSLGHAAAFSFYPTKNLGALGDAGAVTTDDAELAAAVRALANYGSDRRYHNIYRGLNSRLDPMQAALLRVKLPLLDAENRRRRQIADIYSAKISHPDVMTPLNTGGEDCVWHQYVVRSSRRDELQAYLRRSGVATDIHYAVPPHLQPCYTGVDHGPLPLTVRMAAEVLSLPVSACTSESDAAEIAEIINRFPEK